MCPIFYSSKRQRYYSVVQQSKCIYYIHSSPPLSALHSRALTIQLSMRAQPHFTTQQDGKTEYQRCTYSNGHSPISSIILLSWLCTQKTALYPESTITLQSSRVSCYLNEKWGRLLQMEFWIANAIRAGRAHLACQLIRLSPFELQIKQTNLPYQPHHYIVSVVVEECSFHYPKQCWTKIMDHQRN